MRISIRCSAALIIALVISKLVSSSIDISKNNLANNKSNYRVLLKLDKNIDDGNLLRISYQDLKSKSIRRILKKHGINYLVSVFKNRYTADGELKPDLKYPNTASIWRIIPMEDSVKAEKLAKILSSEKGVLLATIEKPVKLKPCIQPDDSEYENQWYLNSYSNPLADIDAELAWNINKGRNDVIIAVCDGGVDYNHSDLDPGNRSRIIAGYDTGDGDNDPLDDLPDEHPKSYAGHGTHIAGIIGAITNNYQDVAGIMWNCKIMPVKMVGSGGIKLPFGGTIWDFSTTAFHTDVADAIDYAVNNGADVINLCYGFSGLALTLGEVIGTVPALYESIVNAYDNNIVIIAAMGNEYEEGNPTE